LNSYPSGAEEGFLAGVTRLALVDPWADGTIERAVWGVYARRVQRLYTRAAVVRERPSSALHASSVEPQNTAGSPRAQICNIVTVSPDKPTRTTA